MSLEAAKADVEAGYRDVLQIASNQSFSEPIRDVYAKFSNAILAAKPQEASPARDAVVKASDTLEADLNVLTATVDPQLKAALIRLVSALTSVVNEKRTSNFLFATLGLCAVGILIGGTRKRS